MRWLGLATSLGLAALLAPTLLARLKAAGVVRENYRGLVLPAASGMLIAVTAAIVVGPLAALEELADSDTLAPEVGVALVFVLGVGVLGLVDDLLGGRRPAGASADPNAPRGLRGHLRAASHGEFSTGMLKALGTLGLALFVLAGEGRSASEYLVGRRHAGAQHASLQPARPAPGPRREGVRRARRGADARLVGHVRAPGAGTVHRSRRWCSFPTTCGSGRCSGTRAPTCSGRSRDCGSCSRSARRGRRSRSACSPFSLFTVSFARSARPSNGTL